jgi:muramoyltetrapeptide carboxypeptidase
MTATLPIYPIAPGSRIQVVAPSSPFPRDEFNRGIARLSERYEVCLHPTIFDRSGYLAGDDARRLTELRAAIEDDSVHAIVAARGGYGATRLIDQLDAASVASHPKLLVGMSDISALHALWARAGLSSIHGPMVTEIGRADDAQLARWIAAVEGATPPPITGLHVVAGGHHGAARGMLLGGNLAVLSALIGTPYLPELEGCVLFLEDVHERPYRIDRMLTSWLHAGLLYLPRAIVLGGFDDCQPGEDGVTVEQVLAERLGSLGIPVLSGVPAGHRPNNLPLPLGGRVEVDPVHGTLTFEARHA